MTNKQIITIFAAGVVLLLVAFWAGLIVKRDGGATSAGQITPAPAVQQTPSVVPADFLPGQPGASERDPNARYLVVVGVFGTEEKAAELQAALRKKHYASTHIRKSSSASGDKLFRVMIGPYNQRESAEQVANELAAEGRKGIKVEKANN